ncbi:MAG: glycine betaine ABC transporter substrate-binding protein, partial [Candidatus Methanomethylophilaceae archaeon]
MKKKELTAIVGVVAILIVAALAVVLLTGEDNVRQMPDISSIAELEEHKAAFDGKIIGIDAGAGIMMATEDAIDVYGLSYTLQSSSSPAMLAALDAAFNKQEAIVVTMWSPHWAVAKYNLVYLDDPEGVFGGAENITTIANTTWATSNPDAAGIGERFNWTMDDIGSVMLAIEEGATPAAAAQDWIDDNPDAVAGWINGVTG